MKTAEYGYAIYGRDGEWVGHVNTWEEVHRLCKQGYDYEILDKESYEKLYLKKDK